MQAHAEWTVLNRGVNGERSDQIAARFERDVIGAKPAAPAQKSLPDEPPGYGDDFPPSEPV